MKFILTLSLFSLLLFACSDNGTTSEAGNAFSMNLTDGAGSPIHGAIAYLCAADATCKDTLAIDTSDAQGTIEFAKLSDGSYLIVVVYEETTMTMPITMNGSTVLNLGNIPLTEGLQANPTQSSLVGNEYWSDSTDGKQKYMFFESESLVLYKNFYHRCLLSEGRMHWKQSGDSLTISIDSSMSMMGRMYPFEAADSAAACAYEYQEMRISTTQSLPFAWVEEPNSFGVNFFTLHFGTDMSDVPDTTWSYKTFTMVE